MIVRSPDLARNRSAKHEHTSPFLSNDKSHSSKSPPNFGFLQRPLYPPFPEFSTRMQAPPIRVTADEINCLIYSYFKDSGFTHSAFTLCNESALQKSPWFHKHIPRGELVDLLGKALLYLEVESHWRNDELVTNCKNRFSLLEHHVCSTEPLSTVPLRSPTISSATPSLLVPLKAASDKPLSTSKDATATQDPHHLPIPQELFYGTTSSIHTNGTLTPSDAPTKRKVSPIQMDGPVEKRAKRDPDGMDVDVPINGTTPTSSHHSQSRQARAPVNTLVHNNKAVMILPGHRSEVFACAFNPTRHSQLASGSKDAVLNFWELPDPPISKGEYATWDGQPTTADYHLEGTPGDVTCLNWNAEGTLLAVGSYDAVLRVFSVDSSLYFMNHQHRSPIFATKFSPNGKWLLTTSLDSTACLYDVKEKRLVRQYQSHEDCCLDAEWLDESTFFTAGADGVVYVSKTEASEPIKKFSGHTDEINQLRCNPSRTRLASCSDDNTIRIWSIDNIEPDSDESIPGLAASDQAVVLTGHTHTVGTIGWQPQQTPGAHEIVATSSFDTTVRIWDAVTGKCLKVLSDHERAVYALMFSPDGKWLATGSGDGWLYVYSTKNWEKRWSWFANPDKPAMFEIAWQMISDINRIAIALECHKVAIVDVAKIPALQDPETIVVNGVAHEVF